MAIPAYVRMFNTVVASDHNFGWVGKRNAAIALSVFLNTNREEATLIDMLPLIHAIV